MSLDLAIREQQITCDAVVEIANKAAEVILAIYDSTVRCNRVLRVMMILVLSDGCV